MNLYNLKIRTHLYTSFSIKDVRRGGKRISKFEGYFFFLTRFSSVSADDQLLLANIWLVFETYRTDAEMRVHQPVLKVAVASNVAAMNQQPPAAQDWSMLGRPFTNMHQLRRNLKRDPWYRP